MRDSRKLMIIGLALWLSLLLFLIAAEAVRRIIIDTYQYHSKPSIPLVEPPRTK